MSLQKVNYIDGQTIIKAKNLNDIQDEVIANEQSINNNSIYQNSTPPSNKKQLWLDTSDDATNLAAYPVGAIYISTISTSPANLFGGIWEAIAGRFLFATGVPTPNTDNYFGQMSGIAINAGLGSTGGQDFHTLTINEMPNHQHNFTSPPQLFVDAKDGGSIIAERSSTAASVIYNTAATGGGQRHNNMPPYLAVNMWKRVS